MGGGKGRPAALGGSGTSSSTDKTIINQIMLGFRPIAPKPVSEGCVSSYTALANKDELVPKTRAKRKYVRVKKKTSGASSKNRAGVLVPRSWLKLLPDTATAGEESVARGLTNNPYLPMIKPVQPLVSGWLDFTEGTSDEPNRTVVKQPVEVWVTMECVADASVVDDRRLGCTDEEKVRNLENDTCPGFVSSGVGVDQVAQWVNMAFRKLVGPQGETGEVAVWLVVKEAFPIERAAFSCRVRVVYNGNSNTSHGKEKQSQTMPCDVWRMSFGGFAWRLDVEAALSLGRR